jgi:methylmalonyl-CoA mutase cobalamin-binding domain/chain
MMDELLEKLQESLLELDKEATLEAVQALLAEGSDHAREGVRAVTDALDRVGRLFQDGEWFLGELVYSGEIAKEAMGLLSPHLSAGTDPGLGTVVVGTVCGDMHDLGKNIFITYAQSAGFEIVDLGTDVAAEQFVEAALEHQPLALGMSCLLTVSAGGIGRVIEELDKRGVRESVKVIIGGAAITEEFAREVGADAFAPDAVTGTGIIRGWSQV